MELQGDKFRITYNAESATVTCAGTVDMRGKTDINKVVELLLTMWLLEHSSDSVITLDVKELEFLNSSGITSVGGFIIKIRNKGGIRLAVRCSDNYSWQARSMKGLQKLMPGGMDIYFE